jgi:hypothetical protein
LNSPLLENSKRLVEASRPENDAERPGLETIVLGIPARGRMREACLVFLEREIASMGLSVHSALR